MVDIVTFGQAFFQVVNFSLVIICLLLFDNHISSGDGTIGSSVGSKWSGFTPPLQKFIANLQQNIIRKDNSETP